MEGCGRLEWDHSSFCLEGTRRQLSSWTLRDELHWPVGEGGSAFLFKCMEHPWTRNQFLVAAAKGGKGSCHQSSLWCTSLQGVLTLGTIVGVSDRWLTMRMSKGPRGASRDGDAQVSSDREMTSRGWGMNSIILFSIPRPKRPVPPHPLRLLQSSLT